MKGVSSLSCVKVIACKCSFLDEGTSIIKRTTLGCAVVYICLQMFVRLLWLNNILTNACVCYYKEKSSWKINEGNGAGRENCCHYKSSNFALFSKTLVTFSLTTYIWGKFDNFAFQLTNPKVVLMELFANHYME